MENLGVGVVDSSRGDISVVEVYGVEINVFFFLVGVGSGVG